MKKRKNKKNNLAFIPIIAILVIILMLILVLLPRLSKKPDETNTANADTVTATSGIVYDKYWLVDNCECIEWNGELSCPQGYELEKDICRNAKDKKFTNVRVACSKYQCPEFIVDLNKSS